MFSFGVIAIFQSTAVTGCFPCVSSVVDLYNVTTRVWTTAQLSAPRSSLAATSVGNIALFAGGMSLSSLNSLVVDLFNGSTGVWSTAQLSVARHSLAAVSVGNVAVFAGGTAALLRCCLMMKPREQGLMFFSGFFVDVQCHSLARVYPAVVSVSSCRLIQEACSMSLTCTTLLQGCGPQLSSAWRAMILQRHLSLTKLSSQGVPQ